MTRRLLVMDVDSALITSAILELLSERAGTLDEVTAIAEGSTRGGDDFARSFRRQVAMLKGLPVSAFDEVLDVVRFTPGAQNLVETLHGRGWTIGLVSEGFVEVIGPLAARLGITLYRANALEEAGGFLTGEPLNPIVDRSTKARALEEFAESVGVSLENTVAVGGDIGDLDLLAAAGLGIAFNAVPEVEESADVAVTSTRLDAILEHLP